VLHGDLLVESAVDHALSGAYEEARAEIKAAMPMIGEAPTARHIAIFAALAVGMALDDRDLLGNEPDAAFIEGAFATGAPRIYGPLAALCAQLRAARGERDAARTILHRALRAVTAGPHVFGSFPLTIVGAQLCDRGGATDVRQLCALTAGAGPPSQHAAELAEAILERRFGEPYSAVARAQAAAAGFAAVGWPFYEAIARETAGDDDAAQRIRERIGYRGKIASRVHAADDSLAPALTPREWQIAQLVASGKTNRDIATALSVSVKLVEKHLSSAYLKLGLTSRSQLTARIIACEADGRGPSDARQLASAGGRVFPNTRARRCTVRSS
jgi:DNA-binding CsgD family transcriptional regulator